jgi:hypothetical protein
MSAIDTPPLTTAAPRALYDKWCVYYHLPQDKTWDLASYKTIHPGVDSVEQAAALMQFTGDSTVRHCMLFAMRAGIDPMWEHARNRTGGAFSFKVVNRYAPGVWRDLFFAMVGETLTTDPANSRLVNGITVSPKKNFVIIKVWMASCAVQDPSAIAPIINLSKQGALFKSHVPEF